MADGYSQDLKVKIFPIETGKLICVLNEVDAKEMGLFAGDRIEISNKRNKKRCVAFIDVTRSAMPENSIGLFQEVADELSAKGKETLIVKASAQLESIDFIKKKMQKQKLSSPEIAAIVNDIADQRLSDVEAAAFISAVYINGLDLDETIYMAKALIGQGKSITFNKSPIVDKHSIGGCNGRATMIIVPIVASFGLYIPKTSSRSITSACGTADAMEVLAPVNLSLSQVKEITQRIGGVISWGGAVDLAPADDKIIRLEHPLLLDPEGQVIASVLAKKATVGSKFVVIDIPVGNYVKIKDKEKAMSMARKFVQVGKEVGMEVEAVITNGDEPSGLAFGPAMEAKYAMEILERKRFDNLAQKSCELAGALFELAGACKQGKGYETALGILRSGKALDKMKEIIKAQGGKILSSEQIKLSEMKKEVIAKEDGVVDDINIREMTKIARIAGAPANKLAGVMLAKLEGDDVQKGDVLFTIYAENRQKLAAAVEHVSKVLPYTFKRAIISTVR